MSESNDPGSPSSRIPPVTENLSVKNDAQGGERKSVWVIGIVLIALMIGGALVAFNSYNSTPTVQAPVMQQPSPQPETPFSVPRQ